MTQAPLKWSGVHHLALYTRDLDATFAFYRDVLGMAVGDIAASPRGRHGFVHLEPEATGRPGLHFWENPDLEHDVDANRRRFDSGTGVMAHVALYLPDAPSEAELRHRLAAANIDIIEFERLGTFAFWDPNGVMVEIVPPKFDEMHPR